MSRRKLPPVNFWRGVEDDAEPPLSAGPLMLDCVEAAALMGVCRATFWKLHSQGRVPLPIRFGRVVRWRRQEIEAWIAAGCPPRDRWDPEKMKPSA